MKKEAFYFTIALLLVGCSLKPSDKIVVPTISEDFYLQAFDEINKRLKSDPENMDLVEQKLYYCEQLNWPTPCLSALEILEDENGISSALLEKFMTYYQRHERYSPLIEIIEKWGAEYDLQDRFLLPYLTALVKTKNRKAWVELRSYLIKNSDSDAINFAAESYLLLGDTTMALYYLGKVYQRDDYDISLIKRYTQLLIAIGNVPFALEILDSHDHDLETDYLFASQLAILLEKKELYFEAAKPLMNHLERDTVGYRVIDLYRKADQWDSVEKVLDYLVITFPDQRKPLWRKARLFEDRGWLTYSSQYYRQLVEKDSTDSLALNRLQLVSRKIAYLQRLKFQESKVPIMELQPKRIEEQ